jgi:Raf kinase inhibitor-like YbhB/YbcL family protein
MTEANMPLTLISTAFRQAGDIPQKYTCDGENISPPFAWSGAPEGTRGFLLTCDDPDAPGKIFHHWAAYDIPPHWPGLNEGHGAESLANGFRQAINDFGKPGYSGPCPPLSDRPHRYHFRLNALSESSLPVGPSVTCVEIIALASAYILEFVELVGFYQRSTRYAVKRGGE